MTKSKRKKTPAVAVIGSGYWGKNLVRNFFELEALKLICDKDDSILQNLKKQYKGTESCLATSDVLSRDDIDGVVIASPAETHFNLAREALLAAKHVFVEKPLVLDEDEGAELIAIAENNNKVLMVGHLLQYHPVFMHLKQIALSGELGRIMSTFKTDRNGERGIHTDRPQSSAPRRYQPLAGDVQQGSVAFGG